MTSHKITPEIAALKVVTRRVADGPALEEAVKNATTTTPLGKLFMARYQWTECGFKYDPAQGYQWFSRKS